MRHAAYSLALAVALLAGPAVADAKPGVKLAVVHVREAMESTKHWKDAYSKLESERAKRQTVIEAKKEELRKKKEAFEAKKAVSDPSKIAGEEEALYREAAMFMQQFQMSQQELSYLEQQLADQMLRRLERVVQQLSMTEGYDYVFEAGMDGEPNVLWSKKGVDITKKVTKAYLIAFKDKPLAPPKLPQGPR